MTFGSSTFLTGFGFGSGLGGGRNGFVGGLGLKIEVSISVYVCNYHCCVIDKVDVASQYSIPLELNYQKVR
jgi:hypothetical protein